MKIALTKYLFLVFVALAILLYWSESRSGVVMGTGAWSLNQTSGRSWVGNGVFNSQIFLWVLMHISTVIYIGIHFFRKETQLIFSLLHVVLVLTYVLLSVYWLSMGWLYHALNIVLLVLNLMYAFWGNKDALKISDDILDA
jgi:hypothetical protein